MSEVLISCEGLVKEFPVKRAVFTGRVKEVFRAVDTVNLEVHAGETLGLVGESGSGKSTTGEILGDLQRPSAGTVKYRGKDIRSLSGAEYERYRRNVQFIFQDPKGSMNPNARIEAILTEPLITLKLESDPLRRKTLACEMCDAVGLERSVLRKFPAELSGGQCQRIAIARALITKPELIVCDEAVSALDVSVQAQILNLLKEVQRSFGLSYLFISHDIGVVNFMADRVAVMYRGKIVESGSADEVLLHPTQDYTKRLLEASFARRD